MTAPSSSSKGSRAASLAIGERILGAARDLFLERGYEGASVRAIARRARCSPGMIYHLYGSKEELLAQLVSQTLGKLEKRLAQCAGGPGTPLERLHKALGAYIDLALHHPHEYEFLFRHRDHPLPPRLLEVFRTHGMASYRWLLRLCEESRRAGLIRDPDADPAELAQCLLAGVHGLAHFLNSARGFPFVARSRLIRRHLQVLLAGISGAAIFPEKNLYLD